MATRIDTVDARERLKPRDEPYWTRAAAGCHLGFRKMTSSSVGTWIAKYRGDDGARKTKSVGEFEKLPKSQRYDAAMKAANSWFEHLGKGGSSEAITVEMACVRYVRHLRETKPSKPLTPYARSRRKTTDTTTVPAADDAEKRFKSYVLDQRKFAATELAKLTPTMIGDWRTRLRNQATRSGGNRGEKRTASSLNRDMTPFRAALNLAYDEQLVTSDFAWRGKLRPVKDADRQRELYIDKDQRRTLIGNAPPAMARFLRGLSLLPLRPGALAALTVASFDKQRGLLVVGKDKNGKERTLKLPTSAIEFFSEVAAGKAPGAPLFQRPEGIAWNKDSWKGPIKEAVASAKLPENTTAYTLRHSTISDLVHGGLDLLTVAQISGTSVRMIEKHYGHLRGDIAAEALARLAL
jgi:integrase